MSPHSVFGAGPAFLEPGSLCVFCVGLPHFAALAWHCAASVAAEVAADVLAAAGLDRACRSGTRGATTSPLAALLLLAEVRAREGLLALETFAAGPPSALVLRFLVGAGPSVPCPAPGARPGLEPSATRHVSPEMPDGAGALAWADGTAWLSWRGAG